MVNMIMIEEMSQEDLHTALVTAALEAVARSEDARALALMRAALPLAMEVVEESAVMTALALIQDAVEDDLLVVVDSADVIDVEAAPTA